MIVLLIFDRDRRESNLLIGYSKNAVAFNSDDHLEIEEAHTEEAVAHYIDKKELLDTAFLDVTDAKGIALSKKIRKAYELSDLLVIADAMVSPMEYMTPDICAASLLLRPFTAEQGKKIIEQFFRAYYRKHNLEKEGKKLVIQNRQGKIGIPYSSIYYVEVRSKKVFVRLKEKEYSKYDTMDHMMGELPEQSIRCHRSFAVNRDYIVRVKLSENLIYLEDEIMVPLSRRYKPDIKAYMQSLQAK